MRPGDVVVVEAHAGDAARKDKAESKPERGVVYRVNEQRIVVAIGGGRRGKATDDDDDARTDLDLPASVRVVKLMNDANFDRCVAILPRY